MNSTGNRIYRKMRMELTN